MLLKDYEKVKNFYDMIEIELDKVQTKDLEEYIKKRQLLAKKTYIDQFNLSFSAIFSNIQTISLELAKKNNWHNPSIKLTAMMYQNYNVYYDYEIWGW